jgi:hypothetical protein
VVLLERTRDLVSRNYWNDYETVLNTTLCRIYVSGGGIEQDRQCAHNVTLRRIHETIVAVEKQ